MIPLVGFAPDIDPMTQGIFVDCESTIPFDGGFKGAPSAVSVGASALPSTAVGAAILTDLSNAQKLYAGTLTKLYTLTGTSWTDVSRGASYSLGTEDRWSFVQYGNTALAATITAKIQRSTGAAFSDIASAPQAAILEQSLGFALAFNTVDATYGTNPDGWWCSAYLDETDWTPALSTQATRGRLIGGAGPITAAKRFGDDIAVYKGRTMFVARYVGSPVVWDFNQVSNDIGCVGISAVTDTLIGHIFVGQDNVYLYDGTTPRPLDGTQVIRSWLFRDINPTYQYRTALLYDRTSYTVHLYYVSAASSGAIDSCVVYHLLRKQWGRANRAIEAVVNYVTPSITYDVGSSLVTTYDTGPMIPFDSPFWTSGASTPAVFDTSHVLKTISGACTSSSFTTGDVGDEDGYSFCDNLRVRYSLNPTTSAVTGYVKDDEGSLVVTGTSSAVSDGRHNMRQTARFHRFKAEQTGDWSATAYRPSLKPAGRR